MHSYIFYGVVLPERAQLSHSFPIEFSHSGKTGLHKAHISIILNQIVVWIDSEHVWDIFDLRNTVKNIVQGNLAIVGYALGHAYDIEITRVLSLARDIYYVFGIDIPCISERNRNSNPGETVLRLREKCIGETGVFIRRCLNDLNSAMKHAEDTGFYCYRAIESLRHHCALAHGLTERNKTEQWEKFREIGNIDKDSIMLIKAAADPTRHGQPFEIAGGDRAKLFTVTWGVVDAYLNLSQPPDCTHQFKLF